MAYYSDNTPSRFSSFYYKACVFSFSLQLWFLCNQAAQLTHLIDRRLREATEDTEREKALKDVAKATEKDQKKAAEAAEKRVQASKKAWGLAEKERTELEMKLMGTKLKLAESLNLAQADEIANLKVALEACEKKWYNEGFANAENSVEPVIHKAQRLAFGEGWLATLQAMGVPKDYPLRNPD